ncbi:MAG TPA: glycogen debranching N-terminal domain-containing protein [Beijerinckiaceae bacterium]|nr:glycogen debranching N-terminal domain-containing protein [Beijerinckiaceae bacterium]
MPLEISVGPPQLAISEGETVLITDEDGQIRSRGDKGLYFLDTRLISSWSISADGVAWRLLNSSSIAHYATRAYLTNEAIETQGGSIAERSLSLVVSRSIGGGLHEDLDLVNHGMEKAAFTLEVAVRSDFADIFEVKSKKITRRGEITTQWSEPEAQLRTLYRNKDFTRELTIRVSRADSPPRYGNGRLAFNVELAPKQSWRACLLYELGNGQARLAAPAQCIEHRRSSPVGTRVARWKETALKINAENRDFQALYDQSLEDISALRLPISGDDHLRFVLAAGVPWFVALFGRDSLIVALQTMLVYPDFARGALEALGSRQARERDDYRDAEPGKIMHELRLGELAHFKLIPHTPYYGTADATILYLIVLHAVWKATGDASLLAKHLQTAQNCLTWIDEYGDRDGDGFQEYMTRSPVGYENQGWKDAGDSVVAADGSQVKGPKALCELQGYVYDAWLRMAEVYEAIDDRAKASRLRSKAADLFLRFNEAFWDEDSGFYAYALDGDKKKVMSVASNVGQCLWCGIVAPERARRVADRLFAPDMCGGWGVRTLSSKNPAYNPYSYQNGAVWPHDNALISQGLRRYGFAREAAALAGQINSAGAFFKSHQMPELYSGVESTGDNFPVQYLGANVPQAWAAGSTFMFLATMLGVQPDGQAGKLYVDPALPDWLPQVEAQGLRVGAKSFDIRFWREGERSRWKVLDGDPAAVELRAFRPPLGEPIRRKMR